MSYQYIVLDFLVLYESCRDESFETKYTLLPAALLHKVAEKCFKVSKALLNALLSVGNGKDASGRSAKVTSMNDFI